MATFQFVRYCFAEKINKYCVVLTLFFFGSVISFVSLSHSDLACWKTKLLFITAECAIRKLCDVAAICELWMQL